MINLAAIVPHSPFLIPNVGKENQAKLKKTLSAYKNLSERIIENKIDTLVLISPHGENEKNFLINVRQNYEIGFGDFGDFSTKAEYESDLAFINELKKINETILPIQLTGELQLDRGFGVPLFNLVARVKIKVGSVNTADLDLQTHWELGKAIKEVAFSGKKNVAVIASADLSHRLNYNSPQGFSPQAKEFDKKVVQLLKKQNNQQLLQLDQNLLQDAQPCGMRSIAVLLGVIANLNYDFGVSYESPFGVGYLTAEFKLY